VLDTVQRNHLLAWGSVIMLCGLAVGCGSMATPRRVVPSYDVFTSQLIQLAADQNSDGRLDQWTYLDGGRPIRGEADLDGDGRIDRWEYFGPQSELRYVGTSSRNDGIEDRWSWAATNNGEARMDRSRERDRRIDRREFFQGPTLIRAESDANGDGRVDRWDRYEAGVLREVAFDTSFTRERADRRVLYDSTGRYSAIEADPDGDGRFEPVKERPPAGLPGGNR
jgi:hypothetical protein